MAKQDKKVESYQVEQRINKVFVDPGTAGLVSSVAGPDAADRNLAYIAQVTAESTAVQSPDAADRNLSFATGGSVEPRDIAPTWIGDGGATATGHATDDIAGGGSIHQE